ncbi:MAG: phosphoribosylanthranilate isomerase [Alphaproteobacteria bacterium]|nr:phosphoribosylanthranilate isomerase [Alphaproteobacteria bacterium]
MSVVIKICGLSRSDTLEAALEAGTDMVGFVFFPPSPRHVTLPQARQLGNLVRGRALKVALTVDADDTTLGEIVAAVEPDLLQLHGRESLERLSAIRARFGLPVIKAIAVQTAADLVPAQAFARAGARILFDAKPPDGAGRPGGLGTAFDWHLLKNLDLGADFMLSGGLDAGNVQTAIAITRPGGVDVSSGVEARPGVKDAALINAFIRAVRASA